MSERIKIEIDDAELDEVIAKLNEAIRKKTSLPLEPTRRRVARRPTPPKPIRVKEKDWLEYTGRIEEHIEEEVQRTVDRLKTVLFDAKGDAEQLEASVEGEVRRTVDRVKNVLFGAKEDAESVEGEVNEIIERLKTNILAVKDYSEARGIEIKGEVEAAESEVQDDLSSIQTSAEIMRERIGLESAKSVEELEDLKALAEEAERFVEGSIMRAELMLEGLTKRVRLYKPSTLTRELLLATETNLERIKRLYHEVDLPGIDRGTRMILYRIPGLREAMRLLYVIKMEQRALKLGEIRGPVTAAITMALYAFTMLHWLTQRQERIDARMRRLDADSEKRLVSMEEALRGYSIQPEQYRGGIMP